MFSDYNKEAYDRETEYSDAGFIVYNDHPDCLYIHILYIKPEYRRTGAGKELVAKVVEKAKSKITYSYVDLQQKNAENALCALIAAGCTIDKTLTTNTRIYLTKTYA